MIESKQSCASCRWSRATNRYSHMAEGPVTQVECRHELPDNSGWPPIHERDWCRLWSEFKENEDYKATVGMTP